MTTPTDTTETPINRIEESKKQLDQGWVPLLGLGFVVFSLCAFLAKQIFPRRQRAAVAKSTSAKGTSEKNGSLVSTIAKGTGEKNGSLVKTISSIQRRLPARLAPKVETPPTPTYRLAPPGFSEDQFETFIRDGILVIENALSRDEVEMYLEALDRMAAGYHKNPAQEFFEMRRVVQRDPALASLIDHPRHVGYVYDLFGEQLKLESSEIFLRPPRSGTVHRWHPDGARAVPTSVFSPTVPLNVRVGYWLTDLPKPKMGNFVYLPGSQHQPYVDDLMTRNSIPGEVILQVPAGSMTIANTSLWHRVEPNRSSVTRKNFFLNYCPSWITPIDPPNSDPHWLGTLNREQQIIMRTYREPVQFRHIPPEHFPLFLDRETGLDHDPGLYEDRVPLRHRKRKTMHEKLAERMAAPSSERMLQLQT